MTSLKQVFWKTWYRYLTARVGTDPVTFLNYGYWPPEGETLDLEPHDEPNRPAIQLYHHVAGGWELADKQVLEVSCGHGGGASFVKRYHQPAAYTAIDQNDRAIAYCRTTHAAHGIDFQVDDAQALSFPEGSFDAVLNVEASHCYPRQLDFFRSVYRVLRPNGRLLWADFRLKEDAARLEEDITAAGFKIISKSDITTPVLEALKRTSDRYTRLVKSLTPAFLHRFMLTFAATEGSGMFNSFQSGERTYLSYRLEKTSSEP